MNFELACYITGMGDRMSEKGPVTFRDKVTATEAKLNLEKAAPDLLAACEKARNKIQYLIVGLGHEEFMSGVTIVTQLQVAIAKAKGETYE